MRKAILGSVGVLLLPHLPSPQICRYILATAKFQATNTEVRPLRLLRSCPPSLPRLTWFGAVYS